MKAKEPKPFQPPEKWTWYRMPYYAEVLLPFKPTHIEWWWVRRGCPALPLDEYSYIQVTREMESRLHYKITRTRGSQDMRPEGQYSEQAIAHILSYAMTRDRNPILPPLRMTDDHFLY